MSEMERLDRGLSNVFRRVMKQPACEERYYSGIVHPMTSERVPSVSFGAQAQLHPLLIKGIGGFPCHVLLGI